MVSVVDNNKNMDQQQHDWAISNSMHNRPFLSQWPNSTLAELGSKINMIADIIENINGDTFAERAEMYYQKRLKLMEMVQDLNRCYLALADKYQNHHHPIKSAADHQSSSNICRASSQTTTLNKDSMNTVPKSSTPLNVELMNNISSSPKGPDHHQNSPLEPHNLVFPCESDYRSSSFASHDSQIDIDPNHEISTPKKLDDHDCIKEIREGSVGENQNHVCKKFSELLEETLSTQAELIKRNEEKTEVIGELRNENKVLKSRRPQRVFSAGNSFINGSLSSNNGRQGGGGNVDKGKKPHKINLRGLFCLP